MKPKINLNFVADFYLAEAVRARLEPGARLYQEATRVRDHLARVLAAAFYDYLFLICMGEARHARNRAASFHFNELPPGDRLTVYHQAVNYDPAANLPRLAHLFRGQKWAKSYGGEKWAAIAEFAVRRDEITPAVFVDHVVDMEHNGGNLFNKSSAVQVIPFRPEWTASAGFQHFLSMKFSAPDLLGADLYPNGLSLPVGRLLFAYLALAGRPTPKWLTGAMSLPTPEYEPFQWGKQALGDPVHKDTTHGEEEEEEEEEAEAEDDHEAISSTQYDQWQELYQQFYDELCPEVPHG